MESINADDRVRNTLPDVEPIDIDYLLEDNQKRAIKFLTTGTQRDKQRFTDLLHTQGWTGNGRLGKPHHMRAELLANQIYIGTLKVEG